MAYQALYRKFRPQTFEDVKGQDHIVTTLKNQLKNDRIGHAYLFTGTRGTGKTTVAKILARAVNCQHPVDGSPCGKCSVCRAINAGSSMNVIEIDAASNNGVNNIREIIEEVAYPPTEGRYKVYIIDEVHMLSPGAYNALLKTLEEPPEYVIFILATTEVNKIPITILSRCQRYDFHRISVVTIAGRLRQLMEEEGLAVEDKAVDYIARAADGSMRDALSLMDQCIAFYLGQKLTYDDTLKVLGAVDTEVFSHLLRAIIGRDVTESIRMIGEIIAEGREPVQFVNDFTWYLRNLLLLKSGDHMEDALDISSDNLALLQEEAQMVEDEILMRYIRILSDLSSQIRYASQKRILIEIAVIKLCKPQMETSYDSLIDRLTTLEEKLEEGIPAQASEGKRSDAGGQMSGQTQEAPVRAAKKNLPAAVPEEVRQLAGSWKKLIAAMEDRMLASMLSKALVSVSEEGELLLVYDVEAPDQNLARKKMTQAKTMEELRQVLAETTGKEVRVKVVGNEDRRPKEQMYTDAIDYFAKTAGVELVEEDF
mgnify:FL=1|nr:DNA polymerase III subunit gamma/tau [Shuttleworthia satelles]